VKPLVLLLIAATITAAPPDDGGLFRQIDEITKKLADITGWKLKRRVPAAMMTKPELDRFLNEKVAADVKPGDIRAEELTLRALGFVDEDYDLKRSVLEVLNEQAAAFYDTKKRRLFMMESSAGDTTILVHELAHALADQYFSLDRFMKHAGKSDDGHLARMAVMEGQATWLMSEWRAQQDGQTLIGRPQMVELMARPSPVNSNEFPALDKAPLYLQETLLFPYTRGLAFQHAVLEKYGQAGFEAVFVEPPQTTQQILHPEAYFEKRPAENVALPKVAIAKGFRQLTEGNLGELDHQILLRQFRVEDWQAISEGWRGGAYKLWENRRTGQVLLLYGSVWETESAAKRFFDVYRKDVLPVKKKGFAEISTASDKVEGNFAGGRTTLLRTGRTVVAIEGLP
jgi:hypothetical protein